MQKIKNILFVAAAAIIVASCGERDTEVKKHTVSQKESLKTIVLTRRSVSEDMQLPGAIEPFEFVQIFPRVNGFVKTINVDRGTVVKKGAVLLTLDAPELMEHLAAARQKYTEALAVVQTSKDKYNRLLETSKAPGVVAPYDLGTAQSKMQADEAMVQGALANYKAQEAMASYLVVRAPFDGVISERNVHPGALVGQGGQGNKPMLILQQQNKFRLIVNVPEQYSSQVKDGDRVQYKLNALPGKTFTGVVSRSSGALNDRYRTESIEVDVPNTDHQLKGGMYAEVVIPAKGNVTAFVVPKRAVVVTTERKYVVAITGGRTKWLDVTTGNQSNDSTEIFGTLNEGDVILANASYEIAEGQDAGKLGVAVSR